MNNQKTTGGISFAAILGTVFVVLKLCKVINWSWLWVTAPFWIPLAVAAVLAVVGIVMSSIADRMK